MRCDTVCMYVCVCVCMCGQVQEALFLLELVPFAVSFPEMANLLLRGFLSLGLRPDLDRLTAFEARRLMSQLIAHSQLLNDLLGINLTQDGMRSPSTPGAGSGAGPGSEQGGSMSTYQVPYATGP